MTISEAARSLGCSKSAVRKAIARGVLKAGLVPAGRRGPYYVIDTREVERYRREHLTPRLVR